MTTPYTIIERGTIYTIGYAHPEAAVLLYEGTSLILLCVCKNARECHRSLIAKLIQDALPVPRQGEVRA